MKSGWEELAIFHEARLLQHLLCTFIQGRQCCIGCGKSLNDTSNLLRHVEIVGNGHAVTCPHCEDFVFAITIERCPLYGIGLIVAPVEESRMTFVTHTELASYKGVSLGLLIYRGKRGSTFVGMR